MADGRIAGVAVVGRPVARRLDDGRTAEVTRTCTDGTPNANSKLYAACARAARAMGYQRLITYTQNGESGVSLRAAGFRPVVHLPPHQGWDRPSRHRPHRSQPTGRTRWEVPLAQLTESRGAAPPRPTRPPVPNQGPTQAS